MGGFAREGLRVTRVCTCHCSRAGEHHSYSEETGKSRYYGFYTLKHDSVVLHPWAGHELELLILKKYNLPHGS